MKTAVESKYQWILLSAAVFSTFGLDFLLLGDFRSAILTIYPKINTDIKEVHIQMKFFGKFVRGKGFAVLFALFYCIW